MFHLYTGSEHQPWAQAAALTREARSLGIATVVLVPQQYTLTAERALMDALQVNGFFDVDVTSPLRLSQRVFEQAGTDDRTRIDAHGKAMAVSRVMFSEREHLRYYENAADRQGFLDSVSRMIADLKRARITPEQLSQYAGQLPEGAVADKYHDLALLYGAYEALLGTRFVDGEDVEEELNRRAPNAPLIRGARLIVAGFDLITEQTVRLTAAVHPVAESVHILINTVADDPAYAPVNDSVSRFIRHLKESGLPFAAHPLQSAFPRPDDIEHLHRSLLKPQAEPYPLPPAHIRLYAAPTPYAEACHAAEQLSELHARGIAWHDMQILCADEAHYFSILDHVLSMYRIPHHLSRKVNAARLGAAQYLLSALTAIAHHYRQDDMLRLLKSEYLPLSDDERFQLENLIISRGIKGWKFERPFPHPQDADPPLEDARQRLMTPLRDLQQGISGADSMDAALMAVMRFLDDSAAFDRMTAEADRLEQENRPTEAACMRQVWRCLMNLLDQAHEIARQDPPDIEEILTLLETGLESTEIAALPQNTASLPCGLIGNIAVHQPQVILVMALNDGTFDAAETGLITDDEQAAMGSALGVTMPLDIDGRLQLKKLDLLKALYAPSRLLFLSHAQALQDGTALRPLDLLTRIRRIFPTLIEEGGVTASQGPAHPYAVMPALEGMGQQLRNDAPAPEWREAWHYLSAQLPAEAAALSAAFRTVPEEPPLPAELVHSLYLERVTSIHRLESFAVCPFRHFLRYVLKPVPRVEWDINRADAGSFYHRALEGFTRSLQNLPGWPDVTRAEVSRLMDQAAEDALDELIRGVMGDSAVKKREYRQYKRLLQRVGWTFTVMAKHSAFRMAQGDAELRFGYPDGGLPAVPLTLSDGRRVYVRGIIDHVERYQGDQGLAFRLIDFKTPNLDLQPEKIFWGTQLQLLIYMQALLNAEPNGIPAGLYYFHLADPVLTDPDTRADVESLLAKALSLKGLTLRDAAIIRLMDDGKPPLSLPALIKADGDFAQNKSLVPLDEMRLLIQHASNVAAHLAEAINTGDITPSPLEFPNENSPCATCDAADLCRRNAFNSGISPRQAPKMTMPEILEKISGREE